MRKAEVYKDREKGVWVFEHHCYCTGDENCTFMEKERITHKAAINCAQQHMMNHIVLSIWNT